MKESIFGIETEFGIEVLDEKGRIICEPTIKTETKKNLIVKAGIKDRIYSAGKNIMSFHPNGSRIYKDIGEHIEYATPECRSIKDLVIFDKAGETIIHKMVSRGRKRENIKENLIIYKNNIDSTEVIGRARTWGCHENYLALTSRVGEGSHEDVRRRRLIALHLLIPFLVTRQIYSGAGWFFLKNNTGNPEIDNHPFYVLSQRAPFVSCVRPESPGSGDQEQSDSRHKQMTSIKDAYGERKFKRLEIRVGESNLAEWSTYLKTGTTAIVLRMIEDGFLEEHLSLNQYNLIFPMKALRRIAKDITCKKRIVCMNSLYLTPIEVQKKLYLEPAKIYLNRYGSSEEEKDIIEKWDYVLSALSDNPLKLADRLDVWIRLKLFLDYMEKHRISWDDWRIGSLNLAYGDIDREKSVFCRLQERGKIKRIVTDGEIQLAETTPPSNTRARPRGTMIKLAKQNNWYYNVTWNSFARTLKDPNTPFPTSEEDKMFNLKWLDPFQSQDANVDRLIKKYGKGSRT